jgi:probable F420-dependent oxidoreductase
LAHVQRIETLGYGTFLIRDHMAPDFFGPQYGPITALATAAAITTTLRVGTMVIDNDFRHPALLAKEFATLHALSGGRAELGIGAGWLRAEYEQAGIPYDRAGVRIDRLEEALAVIKGVWADEPLSLHGEHYQVEGLSGFPKPCDAGPAITIGGGHQRMLRLAGREADVVSILTSSVATGTVVAEPAERTPARVMEKIGWIREGAGSRFDEIELSMIPTIAITPNREAHAARLIHEGAWDGFSVDDVLAMPSMLTGTVRQIVDALMQRREEYGFSYVVVSDIEMEAFAPVVAALAGR